MMNSFTQTQKFLMAKCHSLTVLITSFLSLLLLSSCGPKDEDASLRGRDEAGNLATLAVISAGDFIPGRQDMGGVEGIPEGLSARIIERIVASKRFSVVERTATRRVVEEQRFEDRPQMSDLDRIIDRAVNDLDDIDSETLRVAGEMAGENDLLHDFQDLGSALEADYLIYAKLEEMERGSEALDIPYSQGNRSISRNEVNVRLYLRAIDVSRGVIVGAESLQLSFSETLLSGEESGQDELAVFDELGLQVAGKIIDMVYPARIVSEEPWVVNRGSNDGVKLGDIYQIRRAGKSVRDSNGLDLGRIETAVGQARVIQVQDTISVLEASGGEIAADDLAVKLLAENQNGLAVTDGTSASDRAAAGGEASGGIPRLAIGLVKKGSTANRGEDADQDIPYFTDTLISLISQTKRFKLIDRQEVDQLMEEQIAQALTADEDLPSAMGTLQGADYLLYGSMSKMGLDEVSTKLPGSNREMMSKQGYVEGNMRIVDARSGEILASSKISVRENFEADIKNSMIKVQLADAYGEQVVVNLMNAIYPIKVAAVTADGIAYINRGSDGGLSVGESLFAFRPGVDIKDPDTGVSLGSTETELGEIVLIEVENARAKASGDVELRTGDLIKRAVENKGRRTGSLATVQSGQRSGATLGKSNDTRSSRATLAVGEIQINPNGKIDKRVSANLDRMTEDLMIKLANTRRFELMERSQVDQLLDEKILTSEVSGTAMTVALQELRGADYLVYGSINELFIDTSEKYVEILDETQVSKDVIIEANLRIVDVHGGSLVAADKIRVKKSLDAELSERVLINNVFDELSDHMVSGILERLYPIKVLAAGENIFINRGQDGNLKIGDEFVVMRQGEEMIDEDSGVSFGFNEVEIAKVELIRVEPARAVVMITSGEEVRKGDVLKKPVEYKETTLKEVNQARKTRRPSF